MLFDVVARFVPKTQVASFVSGGDDGVVGLLASGGTESILLAVLA